MANARAESMPRDNIERAIKKALGAETDNYEEIRYEGFGPGGVGLIVEVLTDNRNRTAGNVRTYFGKNGGNMGESGSVAFMFDRLGQIVYPAAAGSEDAVMEAAIEAGAEDVESDAETHHIYTTFENLSEVVDALTATPIAGEPVATLLKLIDALDEDDDVQNVWTNAEIDDADMAKYGG